MYTQISTNDKKDFIQWFLSNFKLKQREATWILTYLMEHDELLAHIHFLTDVKYCPRAIMLTSKCSDQVPFVFYKGQVMTDNPDKLFHDIRMNPEEKLYIQLNADWENQYHFYMAIQEDNPFIPEQLQTIHQDQEITDHLLTQLQYDFQKKLLKEQIDVALDKMEESNFLKLTKELEELESKAKNKMRKRNDLYSEMEKI